MIEDFEAACSLGLDNRLLETLTTCLSVIRGKSRKLDGLYLVRQLHNNQTGIALGSGRDIFDWISEPNWGTSYNKFQNFLAAQLAATDGISETDANAIVKRLFWGWLARKLLRSYEETYRRKPQTLRERAGRLPGAQQVRAWVPVGEPVMTLPAVLKRTSPYYQDFRPIYETIQGIS